MLNDIIMMCPPAAAARKHNILNNLIDMAASLINKIKFTLIVIGAH